MSAFYPTERERLIASGRIVPLTSRWGKIPVLRLHPGEREKFEKEARREMYFDRWRMAS
jgi:hypothetical protein